MDKLQFFHQRFIDHQRHLNIHCYQVRRHHLLQIFKWKKLTCKKCKNVKKKGEVNLPRSCPSQPQPLPHPLQAEHPTSATSQADDLWLERRLWRQNCATLNKRTGCDEGIDTKNTKKYKNTKRQRDKKTKKMSKRQNRQKLPKREFNIVTSGQFCTLAMFSFCTLILTGTMPSEKDTQSHPTNCYTN